MTENDNIIIDRHETYNIYKSKCTECIYFDSRNIYCDAFQDKIPDVFLSGEKVHNNIEKNQIGNFILKIK